MMGMGTNFRNGVQPQVQVLLAALLLLLTSFLFWAPSPVNGHGRLLRPTGRSSLWRMTKFQELSPPANYDDAQLYCGGVHQKESPGRRCGVCGDPLSQSRPRANEIGGRFYSGIIAEQYKSGQLIYVAAQITAPHMGYMEWRLCTDPQWEEQECFDQNLLEIGDGKGRIRVEVGNQAGIFWAKLRLPENVSCEHCVIQWNYRAGNNWGRCSNGDGRLGCGPQETFRACSDVRIVPRTPVVPAVPLPLQLPTKIRLQPITPITSNEIK